MIDAAIQRVQVKMLIDNQTNTTVKGNTTTGLGLNVLQQDDLIFAGRLRGQRDGFSNDLSDQAGGHSFQQTSTDASPLPRWWVPPSERTRRHRIRRQPSAISHRRLKVFTTVAYLKGGHWAIPPPFGVTQKNFGLYCLNNAKFDKFFFSVKALKLLLPNARHSYNASLINTLPLIFDLRSIPPGSTRIPTSQSTIEEKFA